MQITIGSGCNIILSAITIAMVLLWLSLNITTNDDDFAQEPVAETSQLRSGLQPIVRRPTPSASPIAGPAAMLAMRGECYRFEAVDNNGDSNNFEMCSFKSVRQTVSHTTQSFGCGYWKEFTTVQGDNGKQQYLAQVYDNGESCGGSVRRKTTIYFECDPNPDPKGKLDARIIAAGEPEMCQYVLIAASRSWCELEKQGLAAKRPQIDLKPNAKL